MSQDQLRSAIEAIRTQLRSELEAQLEALDRMQREAIDAARRAAEAESHERLAVQVEQVRVEWATRLETELAAAAADADRRTVAECTRARLETEQAAAESIAQLKHQSAAEIERARAEAAAARTDAAAARTEVERLRGEFLAARADADAARAEASKFRADAESARVALEQLRVDAAELRGNLDRAHADAAELRGNLDHARAEAAELRGNLDRARAEAADARAVVAKTRAELEASLNDERARSEAALAAAHGRIETLERERMHEGERASALESELAGLRTQVELERGGLVATLQAERERAGRLSGELAEAHSALERERIAARDLVKASTSASAGVLTDVRVSERETQLAIVERLLDSVNAMGAAQSLTDVLGALVAGAGGEVPRVALFVVNGASLQGFKVSGFDEATANARMPVDAAGVLGEALKRCKPVTVASANSPTFAGLPNDRAGLAVPIAIGGRAVAVLYADDVAAGEPTAPASWPEALQILCEYAAVALAHLTAVRTAQAARLKGSAGTHAGAGPRTSAEDDQAARRYARLLVSEIKLYNEAAVRLGREKRDLLRRLRPEVERARRLYEERVSPGVTARGFYFQQELVQTLADGDPSLLGSPTVAS